MSGAYTNAMGPLDAVMTPWRAAQAVIRAADDLHTLAERARRDPDPLDEARERLDRLGSQLESLISVGRSLDANAASVDAGARALLEVTREPHFRECSRAFTRSRSSRTRWRPWRRPSSRCRASPRVSAACPRGSRTRA